MSHRWIVMLGLVMCTAVSGACGSSSPSSNADPTGAPSTGREAADADTITWAKSGEVLGLDPHVASGVQSYDIMWRVYEPLVQIRDDGTIAPLLATSWKRRSPVVYDFELRRDVRFSNGRQMTSADVVASFERVLDPKLESWHLSQLGVIDSVTAQGRYGVRFTLRKPAGTFLPALAGIGAVILPVKELEAGTFDPKKDLLGTGPYKVERHLQNQSWTFGPNRHYWRKGLPRTPRLQVLIMDDATARMAALRSGRADIATFDNPDTTKLLEDTPGVRVVDQASSNFFVLVLNSIGESSKLRDPRVREAIALALDREQIIELALGGTGEVTTTGTVSELPDACPGGSSTPDVDHARALVSEAGADGLEFELSSNAGYPSLGKIGEVIQGQLDQIGLKPALRPTETGAWLESVQKGRIDATLTFQSAFADNWFGLANWSPGTVGWTKPLMAEDAGFDGLLEKASGLEAGDRRAAVFEQLCESAAASASMIPLASKHLFLAYHDDRMEPVLRTFEPWADQAKHIEQYVKD